VKHVERDRGGRLPGRVHADRDGHHPEGQSSRTDRAGRHEGIVPQLDNSLRVHELDKRPPQDVGVGRGRGPIPRGLPGLYGAPDDRAPSGSCPSARASRRRRDSSDQPGRNSVTMPSPSTRKLRGTVTSSPAQICSRASGPATRMGSSRRCRRHSPPHRLGVRVRRENERMVWEYRTTTGQRFKSAVPSCRDRVGLR